MAIDVNTLKARLTLLQKKADLILATAERRDPPELAAEEKTELTALEKEIDQLTARIARHDSDAEFQERLDEMTGGRGTKGNGRSSGQMSPRAGSTPGELFAAGIGDFVRSGQHHVSGTWRSPTIEVPYAALFATLTEDPASGGKLVIPDYRPGILPLLHRPIVVMDLMASGATDSNAIVYMVEKTFTNAAAPVAEGATKPESALTFDQVSEPVSKIAHWIPATDEVLEDVSGMRSYIDGRLRTGLQLAEDDQLLNGNGVAPNLKGLLLRATAPTIMQGAGENVMDAVLRQIAAITTTAFVPPTGIVMNPADWYPIRSAKNTGGDYYADGPFAAPGPPTLWGLPVAVTTAIVAKTALVGAFATQAQVFRKGGIRLDVSNSHADFYIRNMLAFRAEERLAVATYRPAAFGRVVLL